MLHHGKTAFLMIWTFFPFTENLLQDCRSRMLSIAGGLLSIGGCLGPLIGGLLIHAFHNVLPAFYGAVFLLLCFVIVVFLLLPESLSQEQQLANKRAYAARQRSGSGWGKVLAPMAPLSIFLPAKYEAGPGTSRSRKDWNLTWVAIAYASAIMVLVSRITVLKSKIDGFCPPDAARLRFSIY
jgi:MFS family permease